MPGSDTQFRTKKTETFTQRKYLSWYRHFLTKIIQITYLSVPFFFFLIFIWTFLFLWNKIDQKRRNETREFWWRKKKKKKKKRGDTWDDLMIGRRRRRARATDHGGVFHRRQKRKNLFFFFLGLALFSFSHAYYSIKTTKS